MAIDLYRQRMEQLGELRYAATAKRIRARLDGETVADTTDALLVWEPRRVVPMYAVPPADLTLDLVDHDPAPLPADLGPVLPPYHLEWHTTPGRSLHLAGGGAGRGEMGFRPDDAALEGRVVLHWDPFEWVEEDEPVVVHPHDPFARIDVLASSRHVRVEVDGVTVAESRRATALFETGLPTRWYLPREDVRTDLLVPSATTTGCAYKGTASYVSAEGAPDVAWSYPEPLHDAVPVRDLLSFWRGADVYVDDVLVPTGMPGE